MRLFFSIYLIGLSDGAEGDFCMILTACSVAGLWERPCLN